jgi:transketolase
MFAEVLYDLGREDERIHIVVADISPAGPMAKFREEFPERFINVGVSEQVMIGICAGLALKGMRPFAYTIATFSLYRPFEMVRDDLGYQNLPVVVVGIGGGVIYSTLGGTHYAQEDIAIAGAIPNMTILAPCDPEEARVVTQYVARRKSGGPVYLRFGKAGEKVITQDAAEPFRFGKVRHLWKGEGDVAILSYGVLMGMARQVGEALRAKGQSVSLIACPTMKPLDRDGLADILRHHKRVIVMEEHVPQGGLAPQLKQIAWDIKAQCELHAFTLKDEFVHCYGSHDDILDAHGLSAKRILAAVS